MLLSFGSMLLTLLTKFIPSSIEAVWLQMVITEGYQLVHPDSLTPYCGPLGGYHQPLPLVDSKCRNPNLDLAPNQLETAAVLIVHKPHWFVFLLLEGGMLGRKVGMSPRTGNMICTSCQPHLLLRDHPGPAPTDKFFFWLKHLGKGEVRPQTRIIRFPLESHFSCDLVSWCNKYLNSLGQLLRGNTLAELLRI